MHEPTEKGETSQKCDRLVENQSKMECVWESRDYFRVEVEKRRFRFLFRMLWFICRFAHSTSNAMTFHRCSSPTEKIFIFENWKRFPNWSAQIELISSLHQWVAKIKKRLSTMLTSRKGVKDSISPSLNWKKALLESILLCVFEELFRRFNIIPMREFGVIERKNRFFVWW